jgi:hypothetical protein
MSRPTKATPVTLAAIVAHVRAGLRLTAAAQLEGVEARTVNEWRQMGRDGDGEPHRSFALDVARAEAEFERECLTNIAAAAVPGERGDGDYRASTWLLERTRPEAYAPSIVLLEKAQDTVIDALVEALRTRLSPAAWAEVAPILGVPLAAPDVSGER